MVAPYSSPLPQHITAYSDCLCNSSPLLHLQWLTADGCNASDFKSEPWWSVGIIRELIIELLTHTHVTIGNTTNIIQRFIYTVQQCNELRDRPRYSSEISSQAKCGSVVFCFARWHPSAPRLLFCLTLHELLALVKIPVNFNHNGNDHNTVPLETASYLKYDCVWRALCGTNWYQRQQNSPITMTISSWAVLKIIDLWYNFVFGSTFLEYRPAINNIHFPYIFGHLQPPFFSSCLCQPSFSWTCFTLLGLCDI